MAQFENWLPSPRLALEGLSGHAELLKAMEIVRQHLTYHADAGRWLLPNHKVLRVQFKDHKRPEYAPDFVPTIKFGGDWLREAGFIDNYVRLVALQGIIVIVPDVADYVFPYHLMFEK